MSRPTVTRRAAGGHTVVSIAGDLDFASVDAVTDELEHVLADVCAPLVLDLSATTFLDSAGINLLYEVHAAARTRGHGLGLVVPPANLIHRTLELTGVEGSIPVHATLEEATAAPHDPN